MGVIRSGQARSRARRRRGREQGASAIEFGLLVPLLLTILFGIIDYGFWFNESLNVRQGVREGARMGVVRSFTDTTPSPSLPACNTASADLANLACRTKKSIGAMTGSTYVKITAPEGWARGKPLQVCAMVKATALTGLVPLPSDGLVKSKTRMSIEADSALAGPSSFVDPPPTGGDWTWCN